MVTDKSTWSTFIHGRALTLVGDVHQFPGTSLTARRYITRAIKWALKEQDLELADKLLALLYHIKLYTRTLKEAE